jgi:UDP-2,3-diacylglucosamine pyrophosphatase LpxH
MQGFTAPSTDTPAGPGSSERPAQRTVLRLRTVFISDVHLGFRGCQARFLLDFLRRVECDQLYLVGDVIDMWALTRSFYWPQEHNDVIRTILGKAKHGTRVVYVPGNHDRPFRDHDGLVMGNVEIRREAIHETADGRRFLVLHGDEFDSIVRASPALESIGSSAYAFVLGLNRYVNAVRQLFGFPYWSLAAFLKHRVKNAVKYIAGFERALAAEARRQGLQGVICGHIHRAEISQLDGIEYCNDGDWVESCTALVEDFDGRLGLLRWTDTPAVIVDGREVPLLAGDPVPQPAAA